MPGAGQIRPEFWLEFPEEFFFSKHTYKGHQAKILIFLDFKGTVQRDFQALVFFIIRTGLHGH